VGAGVWSIAHAGGSSRPLHMWCTMHHVGVWGWCTVHPNSGSGGAWCTSLGMLMVHDAPAGAGGRDRGGIADRKAAPGWVDGGGRSVSAGCRTKRPHRNQFPVWELVGGVVYRSVTEWGAGLKTSVGRVLPKAPHIMSIPPMPPIPPIPPPPPAPPPPLAAFSGLLAMMASVVRRREATEAAFWSAVRTTLVGSITPIS